MRASTNADLRLAYDVTGSGPPIVLLHGMTFSRRTWNPIVERLASAFRCVAIDLPGHGETTVQPGPMVDVADRLHRLLNTLDIDRPLLVGHSAASALAFTYASRSPVSGIVDVDQPCDVRAFARLVHQLADALRGPGFRKAFEPFRASIGVELLPEPERVRVAGTQTIDQDVVLSCWAEILDSSPDDLQQVIDATLMTIDAPCLAIFGHELSSDERDQMTRRLPRLELEEWPGRGHMVHLAEPDQFAQRVTAFAARWA